MTKQENINIQPNSNLQKSITPLRIASIRLINDLLLLVITFIFTYERLHLVQPRIVLISVGAITASTLIGYFLIQRQKEEPGMAFLIYGLIFGLTVINVVVERLGPFTLVTLLLVTTLSVSYGFKQRRVIEGISASLILGSAGMIFDFNFRGAAFRLVPPASLTPILWGVILVLIAIFLYLTIRQFPYFPLRVKIIMAFTFITLISLSLLGFFNTRSVKNVLTQEANEALFNAASQTEDSLRQFINFNLQSIKTEAQLPVLVQYASQSETERQKNLEMVSQTLTTLAAKNSEFISSYALLDLQGNVLLDTQPANIGSNEADLNAYITPIQRGSPTMSDVEMDPITGEPSLYFSAPVVENSSIIVGVLRVRYQASVLQSLIENSNGRGGNNSFAVLFDENFLHLAHGIAPETIFTSVVPLPEDAYQELVDTRRLPADQTEAQTYLDLPDLATHLNQSLASNSGVIYFDAEDIATGDKINRVVVLNLGNPAWLLAFFQPQEIYLSPIESLTSNTIFLSLVSGLGTVMVAIILTQVLTAPITRLNETARQLSRGNLETRVEVVADDEIGTLAETFNTMSARLKNLVENLENQVRSRTKDIENRAMLLQAATEVARDATAELQLQDMLVRAATLIQDRFGYYHVGIYLKDANNENLILAASQDRPGLQMLENDQRYKIGTDSNLGLVCILGESKIASTQDPSSPLQYHPFLPNSQAQLCLPLNLADETLGVIDIHSTNPVGFTQDDVQIFQTLADQLSIAIQKARYNEEIQDTLHELETAYGTFTRKSWQRFIQSKAHSGYRYRNMKTEPAYHTPNHVIEAWKQASKVEETPATASDPNKKTSTLAIPMKVRGEVIGVLNLEFESDNIPADTSNLVAEIAERLSLIIENARLVETAKNQVDREQLASHISNTIRQSLDMDVVLRTTVQEIGQSLNLPEVEIRLGNAVQNIQTTSAKVNGNNSSNTTD